MRVAISDANTSPTVYTPRDPRQDATRALVDQHSRSVLPLDGMLTLASVFMDDFTHAYNDCKSEITNDIRLKGKLAFDMLKDSAGYMHGRHVSVTISNNLDEHEDGLRKLIELRKNKESGVYQQPIAEINQ